jgi:uncharacterized membrane protein YdjX (TVP38/TMEM64 family)
MTEPSGGQTENPYQPPVVSVSSKRRAGRGRRAQAMAFIQLAFQFKFLGVILLLFGLLWTGWVLWLGIVLAAGGVAFLLSGYAIGSYKSWGWYAGVALVIPLLVMATVLALLFALAYGGIFAIAALLMTPLYCYYIVWTLFSRSGRQRYDESVRAMAAAKANPESIAGRLYRKR